MFGRTHVTEYDPMRGAHHYVGKYMTKRLTDFDLWTYGTQTPDIR